MAMWHAFPCTHTPKSGGVAMGKATVVVAVCEDDVMGCACHPHTPHTGRESSHKGTCHPHHVCVRQKSGQWMSTVALWCVVVVGEEGWRGGCGGKSTERGECGWWMKRGMV